MKPITGLDKRGFTFAEFMMASVISVLVLTVIFTLWQFSETAWYGERAKSRMLGELEIAMERIKEEMRYSNADEMFYYPSTAPFSAISLPIAVDDDGDGFIELVSNKIKWDRTVIYHVYNSNTETQLKRTIFNPRITLSDANRQSQLNSVVTNGEAVESTYNYSKASTRTLFSHLLISGAPSISLEITPKLTEFDGYNTEVERSSNVSFGSIGIAPGYHELKFKVTGTSKTGYGLGIDLFRITPSGSDREGDDYKFIVHPDSTNGIKASSGDTVTREDMTSYGTNWSSDYQLDFAANSDTDYITLKFYNDVWRESNFDSGSVDLTVAELSNRTGKPDTTAATSDVITRLEGSGVVWDAGTQTGGSKTNLPITPPVNGDTYRNVIRGQNIVEDGRLLIIKFAAGTDYQLIIDNASICKRASVEDGVDGTVYGSPGDVRYANITFDSGSAGATISAGGDKPSDPIDLIDLDGDNDPDDYNTDKSDDYLITIHVPQDANPQSISTWENSDWDATAAGASSYKSTNIDDAELPDKFLWTIDGSSVTSHGKIYGIEEIEVTYVNDGTFTSQVYDTKLADPVYKYVTWDIVRNNWPDANLTLKVRSNDSKDTLLGDTTWSTGVVTVDTQSATHGSTSIAALGTGQYVQFRADFSAIDDHASEQTDDRYDMSCVLKDAAIYWEGGTVACDLSGYFTLKPTYGIFGIEIDDKPLTKGFEVKLEIEEDVSGNVITRSLTAEAEPRNTGK